jgi:hypothetical protein
MASMRCRLLQCRSAQAQLDKIPLLKAQLDQYIDPATGLINTELTGPMKPPTAEATIPPADAPAEEAAPAAE